MFNGPDYSAVHTDNMNQNHTVEKGDGPAHIIVTPIWVLVIRVFQFLLALIILGLSANLIHQAYLDEFGLALAIVSSQHLPLSVLFLTADLMMLPELVHLDYRCLYPTHREDSRPSCCLQYHRRPGSGWLSRHPVARHLCRCRR